MLGRFQLLQAGNPEGHGAILSLALGPGKGEESMRLEVRRGFKFKERKVLERSRAKTRCAGCAPGHQSGVKIGLFNI